VSLGVGEPQSGPLDPALDDHTAGPPYEELSVLTVLFEISGNCCSEPLLRSLVRMNADTVKTDSFWGSAKSLN
jgi:hypothetical protein